MQEQEIIVKGKGKKQPAILDKGSIKISNILENLERTYLPLGSQIGKYRILEEIDRGGMAVVYKAHQLDLDRTVALKVLPANVTINRRFVERFLSEAHAVAKLNHPNIISIHEVSMENNVYYLAMDYIPGLSLYYYLNQKKPKLVDVLEIIIQLADALAYAHEQKIVHRDLKLNNVIMKDNKSPVLIDFGLAKALEDDDDGGITRTGEIMGSPAYMAPERLYGGGSDARSDICSLGIMLYEMLTFKNPYLDPRSIHQTTMNVMEAAPIPPRKLVQWLPVEMESITLKAMHKDPAERYQTMEELRDDMKRYQRGEPVHASPPSVWSKSKRFLRKRWAPLSFSAIILVFSAILGVFMHMQSRKEQWRWQLVHSQTFEDTLALADWSLLAGAFGDGSWELSDGALRASSETFSFIRFDRLFTRDLRFEFDLKTTGRYLRNAGFFMCGDSPSEAYGFHIHHPPSMLSGMTMHHSDFLFYEYDPMTFSPGETCHVVVEKTENLIQFKINGALVSRAFDFWPPLGKRFQRAGFFVHGGDIAIDNLQIYRRSVPMLASPTIIADRFWEHGDVETALNEYRELLLDFSREDIVRRITLRIANCLIRLGRYDEAEEALASPVFGNVKEEALLAKVLYLRGELAHHRGDRQRATRLFNQLNRLFPASTMNKSVVMHEILEAESLLERVHIDSAERRIMEIARDRPRFSRIAGRLHTEILETIADMGKFEQALAMGERIIELHAGEDDIVAKTRIILGRLYLANNMKYKGVDMLNRATTSSQNFAELWPGWFLLAEVYEHDHKYRDALSIYRKIAAECPESFEVAWMARVKAAELTAVIDTAASFADLIGTVVEAEHPFALPRAVGRYYLGDMSAESLAVVWKRTHPHDSGYLYYLAKRDMISGDSVAAARYLRKLLRVSPKRSWAYVKYSSLLNFLNTSMVAGSQ